MGKIEKKSNTCGSCLLATVLSVVIISALFYVISEPKSRSRDNVTSGKESSSRDNMTAEDFEEVGYFKSKKMRGFTVFMPTPRKAAIESFCLRKKMLFPNGRILKIHFYDNRENTPNVTGKYYFPQSSDQYLVADYFFNPFNNRAGLKFHKNID